MSNELLVGIDPGVRTGFAVWNRVAKRFAVVATVGFPAALSQIVAMHNEGALREVIFEDARKRSWFGSRSIEALQGAGSIKRDCSLWEEFLTFHAIPFLAVSPQQKGAKLSTAQFARITGWRGLTSEHSRDAGMLVFGR